MPLPNFSSPLAKGRYGDSEGQTADLLMDGMTNSFETISFEHYKIHQGYSFHADVVDASMADTETLILAFKTPATRRVHILFGFSSLVGGYAQVYEGATWTQGTGAAVSIINRNRSSSIESMISENRQQAAFVANMELMSNVTGVGVGSATLLTTMRAWGIRNQAPGPPVHESAEYILASNTQYLYRFTAVGGSNAATLLLNWYEHTDSNAL